MPHFQSIGSANTPWSAEDKVTWFRGTTKKRDYKQEVVNKLFKLGQYVDIEQYGSLSIAPDQLPLYCAKSKQWQPEKPTILITGGVHGYETSGVHGALLFIETSLKFYESHFNFIVAPCVSPWGYETINRWNPKAIDPNRLIFCRVRMRRVTSIDDISCDAKHPFLSSF